MNVKRFVSLEQISNDFHQRHLEALSRETFYKTLRKYLLFILILFVFACVLRGVVYFWDPSVPYHLFRWWK